MRTPGSANERAFGLGGVDGAALADSLPAKAVATGSDPTSRTRPSNADPRRRRRMHPSVFAQQHDRAAVRSRIAVGELSSMFSNTGAVSASDPLITRSTSAEAVCRSSASWVSLNIRAFWIAITAWSPKVLSSASSLSVKALGGWRNTQIEPTPRFSHSIGAHAIAAWPLNVDHVTDRGRRIGGQRCRVRNMQRAALAYDLRGHGLLDRLGERACNRLERRSAPCAHMHLAIVGGEEDAELLGGEQVLAAVEDLVEYRRRIGHRAADHLQHLGGGGLLLQRFLGLADQSHVLDGDDRLAREGLQQVDLPLRRLTGIRPGDNDLRQGRDRPSAAARRACAASGRAGPGSGRNPGRGTYPPPFARARRG